MSDSASVARASESGGQPCRRCGRTVLPENLWFCLACVKKDVPHSGETTNA